MVISHDRWFLDRVATHILAWEGDDDNPAKWYWFEGNFQSYQENKVLASARTRPVRTVCTRSSCAAKPTANLRTRHIACIRRKPSRKGRFPYNCA